MSEEINRIPAEEVAKFFLENGILFELNRTILHPYGLALEVKQDDEGNWVFGGLWDYRDDPEGMLFAQELFEAGEDKWNKFQQEHKKNIDSRLSTLGWIKQERYSLSKGKLSG